MINLGNSSISTITISTIFGHDGSGILPYLFHPEYNRLMITAKETNTTVFAKSATFNPHEGNVLWYKPWTYYQFIRRIDNEGMVNAYGLTNDGIRKISYRMAKTIKSGIHVKPNLYPQFTLKGLVRTQEAIDEILVAILICRQIIRDSFTCVEINGSCPNSEDLISQNMSQLLACLEAIRREYPWLKIILKTSYLHPDEFFAEISQRKLADVLHNFNTIDYQKVYGYSSPLKNGAGGASGGPIRELCFRRNEQVAKLVNLPIIMGGGVQADNRQIQRYFDIGASSLSLCTAVGYHPNDANDLLLLYNR